jgi:hypothetical protein
MTRILILALLVLLAAIGCTTSADTVCVTGRATNAWYDYTTSAGGAQIVLADGTTTAEVTITKEQYDAAWEGILLTHCEWHGAR